MNDNSGFFLLLSFITIVACFFYFIKTLGEKEEKRKLEKDKIMQDFIQKNLSKIDKNNILMQDNYCIAINDQEKTILLIDNIQNIDSFNKEIINYSDIVYFEVIYGQNIVKRITKEKENKVNKMDNIAELIKYKEVSRQDVNGNEIKEKIIINENIEIKIGLKNISKPSIKFKFGTNIENEILTNWIDKFNLIILTD